MNIKFRENNIKELISYPSWSISLLSREVRGTTMGVSRGWGVSRGPSRGRRGSKHSTAEGGVSRRGRVAHAEQLVFRVQADPLAVPAQVKVRAHGALEP